MFGGSEQVLERIERLPDDHGESKQNLLEYLWMNRSTYSNWRLGKSRSYLKHIDEIATFLDISPSYLIRGIEDGLAEGTIAAVEDEMLCVQQTEPEEERMCNTSCPSIVVGGI